MELDLRRAGHVLVGDADMPDLYERAQQQHDVDRAVARSVRMEPRMALAEAVQATEPGGPALGAHHVAGLRAAAYLGLAELLGKTAPALERVTAARVAGQLDKVSDADHGAYDESLSLTMAMCSLVVATPFFVPAGLVERWSDEAPAAPHALGDVELPAPTASVWFGRPIEAGHDGHAGRMMADVGLVVARRPGGPGIYSAGSWVSIAYARAEGTGAVATIVPQWHRDHRAPATRVASQAVLAIARGQYTDAPPGPEAPPLTRAWRQALAPKSMRRALAAGAVIGVRAIDAPGPGRP